MIKEGYGFGHSNLVTQPSFLFISTFNSRSQLIAFHTNPVPTFDLLSSKEDRPKEYLYLKHSLLPQRCPTAVHARSADSQLPKVAKGVMFVTQYEPRLQSTLITRTKSSSFPGLPSQVISGVLYTLWMEYQTRKW